MLLIALPFFLLWIAMGLTVDESVFKFWEARPRLSPLTRVTLTFVPMGFMLFYLLSLSLFYRRNRSCDWPTVGICALISYFLAYVLSPIP